MCWPLCYPLRCQTCSVSPTTDYKTSSIILFSITLIIVTHSSLHLEHCGKTTMACDSFRNKRQRLLTHTPQHLPSAVSALCPPTVLSLREAWVRARALKRQRTDFCLAPFYLFLTEFSTHISELQASQKCYWFWNVCTGLGACDQDKLLTFFSKVL